MTCVICKVGETKPGAATITLTRGDMTNVFRGVPADVCSNCGEEYVSDPVVEELLREAEQAVAEGVHVTVRDYVAA